MRNTKAKIPVMFIVITVVAACVLHFFKLMQQTGRNIFDFDTDIFSYVIYALMAVCAAACGIYASGQRDLPETFDTERKNKKFSAIVLLLSVSMFFDFLHQCYNCYEYVQSVAYIEYAYLVPIGLSGLAALLCSFYFLTFSLTYKNDNYDFRNFTWLHFAPVLWAFVRMLMIMSRIVDIKSSFEICCEFLFLCVLLCFLFCVISALERKGKGTTKLLVFSAVSTFSFSVILTAARIIMIVTGGFEKMDDVTFSNVTYMMTGIFALALITNIKRSKEI